MMARRNPLLQTQAALHPERAEREAAAVMTVLIADADPVQRAQIGKCVPHGARIVHAANGEECLGLAGLLQLDVICIDTMLPVNDGLETIAELRRRGVATPIIAMSAGSYYVRAALLERARVVGADAGVRKPVSAEELSDQLDALVN